MLSEQWRQPLEHYHLTRCSPQLRSDTVAVEAWGRARWPGARVMHELPVGGCRLDIAFVLPNHLVAAEIKSERDTLGRLSTQVRNYVREMPEVWVIVAPKWVEKAMGVGDDYQGLLPWTVGLATVADGVVSEQFTTGRFTRTHSAKPDLMLTAPMLHLLWRSEVASLAGRHGVALPKRFTLLKALPILSRRLTGDQIVAGVCAELRARVVGGRPADPPAGRAALTPDQGERDGNG